MSEFRCNICRWIYPKSCDKVNGLSFYGVSNLHGEITCGIWMCGKCEDKYCMVSITEDGYGVITNTSNEYLLALGVDFM